ncbi:PD-(D/E)XK nuclease family protein [Kitasatospora herbaricolor]|uniref:PD-(D/E)XK nuclease family protein n=1 Tax=Kitasatospora herbaricolor TaxID=68217 RepID=UPI0036DC0053
MELVRRQELIRASATDAQDNPGGCGLYAAAKARPKVRAAAWQLRYDGQPFMLRVIRESAVHLHGDDRVSTWEGLQAALKERIAPWDLHPGVRIYVEHAVEHYLDAHDELAARFGEARFARFDPTAGGDGRELTAWAPLYQYQDGTREVRRMRLRSARSSAGPEDDRWSAVAAHAAAGQAMRLPASLIRVVEVGLFDGSTEITFEGTPQQAYERYAAHVRPVIQLFLHSVDARPGRNCHRCKLAGCCASLVDETRVLGQESAGTHTRSVSASDLELYSKCAARWYLERVCHLPKDDDGIPSTASERGRAVHRWLADAHARNTPCIASDTGSYDAPETFTGSLGPDEYEQVRDFLAAHVGSCPLDGVQGLSLETPVYGYDAAADVIIASQPDLVYVDSAGRVVIRETKTAVEMPEDANDAFDRFFAVAWLINIAKFAKGAFGESADLPRVELEVITPERSQVFTWQPQDEGVARMAHSDVRQHVSAWHHDAAWPASPGPQCSWCPVRRWCPDAADPDAAPAGQPYLEDEPCAGMPPGSPE